MKNVMDNNQLSVNRYQLSVICCQLMLSDYFIMTQKRSLIEDT